MDKTLKNISNLSQYINISQDLCSDTSNKNLQLNLSAVLALKKIRSFEIEYFNKYEATGVAVKVLDCLLEQPPSKTWGLLSKELISLLQYWLDALRKHLLNHSLNWWMFLKTLLKFLKSIRQKHLSIPNILVEETADCLLDLATNIKLDVQQRYEVLSCFNLYCSESSREVRVGMKSKLDGYFLKLCTFMSACGHFPTQHSILEAILRWTIGRQDKNVRTLTIQKWFLKNLYSKKAIDFFLEKKWNDFFHDARQFLNLQNDNTCLVTSVICKKMTAGDIVLVSGAEKKETWLDINSKSKTITLLLDPRYLGMLGPDSDSCYETITIYHDNAEDVILSREPLALVIQITIHEPLELFPSCAKIECEGDRQIKMAVSRRSDPFKLDRALRTVFEEKYQLLMDLDATIISTSPMVTRTKNFTSSEEELHSVNAPPRKSSRSGYVVRTRFDALRSPSTTSTSSLIQLHEKLSALPRFRFDKEPVSVVARPELSNVTEITEPDTSSVNTTASTFKLRHCGVFDRSFKNLKANQRKSQSDGEIKDPKDKRKCISPAIHDENSISCLLVATIGTSDEGVINDTLEKLPKDKGYTTDSIVDLLVQEALQTKRPSKDKNINSGFTTDAPRSQGADSELVEYTQLVDSRTNEPKDQIMPSVIESSSSDESNTEDLNEICDTPVNFVNTRKRSSVLNNPKQIENKVEEKLHIFDGQVVENFFSQHLAENAQKDVIISPTLAKKINETTSESSDFDYHLNEDFNDNVPLVQDFEIVSCLNDMLDRVCHDLDKCTEYLNQKLNVKDIEQNNRGTKKEFHTPVEVMNSEHIQNETTILIVNAPQKRTRQRRNIKLDYKMTPKKKRQKKTLKNKNKLALETTTKLKIKMSTINEVDEILEAEEVHRPSSPENPKETSVVITDKATPLLKRKRKLYSPKQDEIEIEKTVAKPPVKVPETEGEDTNLSSLQPFKIVAPLSLATPYKEIEKERKRIRKPRTRKSKDQSDPPLSPRTIKRNDIFDKIKGKIESSEKIILADKNKDVGVYNFSSDSEDEDFQKKKVEISKRTSSTTIGSFDSSISTKRGRVTNRVNYKEKKSDSATEENHPPTRKKRSKLQNARKTKSKTNLVIPHNDLIDERMREAKEVVDSTFVAEEPTKQLLDCVPEPVINKPDMEIISCTENYKNFKETDKIVPIKPNKRTKRSNKRMNTKKEAPKSESEPTLNKDDDESGSPLPGLVVETVVKKNDELDDSITMMKKFKKVMKYGPTAIDATQNLLSDNERENSTVMDTTEEVNRIFEKKETVVIEDAPIKRNLRSANRKPKEEKVSKKEKILTQGSSIEVINIGTDDNKSEKSIKSVGITGHGDSDEIPPGPELLNEEFAPRNIDIQDLDKSTRDYFLKLTREIKKSSDSSDEGKKSIDERKKYENIDIPSRSGNETPVERVLRMSSGEIHAWFPSPRSTDSEISEDTKNTKEQSTDTEKRKTKKNLKEIFVDKNYEASTSTSVPKWSKNTKRTAMPHDTEDTDTNNSEKENIPRKTNKKDTNRIEKENKPSEIKKKDITKTKKENKTQKNIEPISETRGSPRTSAPKEHSSPILRLSCQKRKTLISPIDICFGDFLQNTPVKSQKSTKNTEPVTTRPESSKLESISKSSIKSSEYFKGLRLRKAPSEVSRTSPYSKVAVSTPVKRKAAHTVIETKKRKTQEEEEIALSGSVSSVAEWFKRMPQTEQDDHEDSSALKDCIDVVMEKIDTTLAEIHQNSSQRWTNYLVDIRKGLQQQQEARHKLYKDTAKSILMAIPQILEEKFTELERRSQELEKQFLENLKKDSCKILKDDSKQKRAMVVLLKEDVQAVNDHLKKFIRK